MKALLAILFLSLPIAAQVPVTAKVVWERSWVTRTTNGGTETVKITMEITPDILADELKLQAAWRRLEWMVRMAQGQTPPIVKGVTKNDRVVGR